jgi:hypothetical protein
MTQKKSNGKAGSLEWRVEFLERREARRKKFWEDMLIAIIIAGYACSVGVYIGWLIWG